MIDGRIAELAVTGVDPALASTLRGMLATKVGDQLADAPLAADLRTLITLGVLTDAWVDVTPQGDARKPHAPVAVEFVVTTQPLVGRVEAPDAIELRPLRWLVGTSYEPRRIARMADAIERAYVRDGHLDARVSVRAAMPSADAAPVPRSPGVALCVATDPGPLVAIGAIRFPGRRAVPESKLLGDLHGAKEHIDHVGGVFDADAVDTDLLTIEGEYWDHGMLDAKVGPVRTIRHGDRLDVEIPVREGPVFHVGEIRVANTLGPVRVGLPIARGDVAARAAMRNATTALETTLGRGVYVYPRTTLDAQAGRIDLTLVVVWRWPWHVLRT